MEIKVDASPQHNVTNKPGQVWKPDQETLEKSSNEAAFEVLLGPPSAPIQTQIGEQHQTESKVYGFKIELIELADTG